MADGALNPTHLVGRVILDAPASGRWNMAVDEALLHSALAGGPPTVRWYRWSEPTVSLGYFQDASDACGESAAARLPRVRRLSGGGAILHHHELTYSLVLPPRHPLARDHTSLYGHVHRRLIGVLARNGLAARLRSESLAAHRESHNTDDESSSKHAAAFLCFARGDSRDVVVAGHKVIGSAQRRRRGAILQHGSVLLARSEFAPQFPGLAEIVPAAAVDGDRLVTDCAKALGGLLGTKYEFGAATPEETRRGESLVVERYSKLEWKR